MSAKAGGERPRSQSGLASVPSLNEIREGLADVAAGNPKAPPSAPT